MLPRVSIRAPKTARKNLRQTFDYKNCPKTPPLVIGEIPARWSIAILLPHLVAVNGSSLATRCDGVSPASDSQSIVSNENPPQALCGR